MNKNRYNNPLKFNVNTAQGIKRPNTFRFRNPKLFVSLATCGTLIIFFSKPLYDLFLNDQTFDLEQLKKEHKSRIH